MNIFLLILNSFYDFYGIYQDNLYNNPQRISLTSGKFWIDQTQFSYLVDTFGGAVYLNSNIEIKLLIENCIFFACNSTSHSSGYSGGAICLISSKGDFILNKICATSCKAPSISGTNTHGQFTHISSGSLYKIYILLSTIYNNCPSYYLNNECSQTSIIYGNHLINHLNTSKTNIYKSSGIVIFSANSLNLSFSNFFECTTRDGIIIYLYGANERIINNCNIISNISPSFGIIYNQQGTTIVDHCIFKNNSNFLISNSATITVQNSFISHGLNTGFNIGTNLLILTESFNINFFNTFLCENNNLKTKIKQNKIIFSIYYFKLII